MKKDVTLVFAGGDARTVFAARQFVSDAVRVLLTGFDRFEGDTRGLMLVHLPQDALLQADAVVLPLPYTKGGGVLNAPLAERSMLLEHVFSLSERAKAILGGMLPAEDERFFDYYDEAMMLRNADVTAEAALVLAGNSIGGCLNGANAVVVGYGRIGKRLAAKARALGCNVTVAARKERDHALIRMCGHESIGVDTLSDALCRADVVFNTVPAEVFCESMLLRMPAHVPLIDLADSIPSPRAIRATGLPGKYAPEAAGKILADSVRRILTKEGIL